MHNNKNKHSGGVSCSACNAFITIRSLHCGMFSFVSFKDKIKLVERDRKND